MGSDVVGLFGLAGAFGALGASFMGRLSDKGASHRVTTYSIGLIVMAYVILGFSGRNIPGLVVGVILPDLGIQATHIANQTLIFSLRPEARNRLNTVYMVTYFSGGAAGAFLASQAWYLWQWPRSSAYRFNFVCSGFAAASKFFIPPPNTKKRNFRLV